MFKKLLKQLKSEKYLPSDGTSDTKEIKTISDPGEGDSSMTAGYTYEKSDDSIVKFVPKTFEEIALAVKHLSRHREMLVDFSDVTDEKVMKQCWIFLNGAIVALGGKIEKIESKLYQFVVK